MLLLPSCKALKDLILICENFASEYKLNFNPQKVKMLIYSRKKDNTNDINIKIGGHKIEVVQSEKHIGHTIQTGNNIVNIDNIIRDIKIHTNSS